MPLIMNGGGGGEILENLVTAGKLDRIAKR